MRVMPSGTSSSRGDDVPPRGAPQPRDRLAEEREAEVAVVVVLPRPGHRAAAVVGGEQRVQLDARVSAPTTSRPVRSACRRRARAGSGPSRRRTRSPGRTARSGRRARAAPRRAAASRATATRVLVIEPIRYCVSSGGPATSPAPPDPAQGPVGRARRPRPTAAGRDPGSAPDGSAGRSFGERLDRRARADEVAVAVRLVDAGDRRPVLVGVLAGREHAELALVGPLPLLDERPRGVRRVAQR